MTFNMKFEIKQFNGDHFPGYTADKPMTLADVCTNACLGVFDRDKSMSGTDKYKLYKLAEKAMSADIVDFSIEEIAKIKERIKENMSPLIVGRVCDFLEPPKAQE